MPAVTPIWDNTLATATSTRPGVYINFASVVPAGAPLTSEGIMAVIGVADWGPFNSVFSIKSQRDIDRYLGSSGTIRTACMEALRQGAEEIKFYRIGAAAKANATLTLNDGAAAAALTVTAKYPGTFGNGLRAAVITNVLDSGKKDLQIYEGTTLREVFTAADNDDLVAQFTVLGSDYVTIAVSGTPNRIPTNVAATPLAGGNSGTAVVAGDYTAGQTAVQNENFRTLVLDTSDSAIQVSLSAFITTRRNAGYKILGVCGAAQADAFATKRTQAIALNNEGVVYVVSDYVTNEGVALAPFWSAFSVAATIAVRDYLSVTYRTVTLGKPGTITLSATEYGQAMENGMLVLSNDGSRVFIESGINTLQPASQVAPRTRDWRKIRYVSCQDWIAREVWLKLSGEWVGQIENDERGRQEAIRMAQEVLTRAMQLRILDASVPPTAFLDGRYVSTEDRVFIALNGKFVDTIEKFFFTAVI